MKKYYHATSKKNLGNILNEGIKKGCDGCVYLTDKREDALKFVIFGCANENIIVFEVELNEEEVVETFDHSESFFKCKAYGYYNDINAESITGAYDYPPLNTIINKEDK